MFKSENQIATEKICIAGLVKFPEIISEIDGFVGESDFTVSLNRAIFSICRQLMVENQTLDKYVIATKINNLNLKFSVGVVEYLESLSLLQINKDGVISHYKELVLISAKRKIYNQAEEIQKYLKNSQNDKLDAVIGKCDGLYAETVNSFSKINEPQDLFAGAEEYVESLGLDKKDVEIKCPYPIYQRTFGGWFPGDLVVFVSPPKSGKSTLLLDILIKVTESNEDVRALIIDTELETYRVQRRLVSNLSGVHEYLIKTGNWRNNSITLRKIRETWPLIKEKFSKIDHIYVGNATPEEQISIMRRWHFKNINTTGKRALIALDYFKLTSVQNVSQAYAGSMMLGYAVDNVKKLASELQCPILSCCQANSSDETGLSKEINKFASSVFLFKRKTIDDIALEGGKSTHKLVPNFTRDVGLEYDSCDFVKSSIDKKTVYLPNHINFAINSFNITEMNTLKDQLSLHLMPRPPEDEQEVDEKGRLF